MNQVAVGQKVPNFSLPSTSGTFNLQDYIGKYIVLYFYPKDNTPGCTQEGNDFKEFYEHFKKANAEIFGISRDSLDSHKNFKQKQSFPFDLLTDSKQTVCSMFSVLDMRDNSDTKTCKLTRTTFLIDPEGTLIREWRGVKVNGHIKEVLECLPS